MMTTGQKLKETRTFRKMTQKMLSDLTGISVRLIQKYEADERSPKDENIAKLATALGVSPQSISDAKIDTYVNLMYAFFELEKEYGEIAIESMAGKTGILFKNPSITDRLLEWKEAKDSLSLEEMKEWELTYPRKIVKTMKGGKLVSLDEAGK